MYEEFETTAFIRKILTEEGIEILDLPIKTGLVARITGSKPGKKIAFLADMDALPLEEKTNLPYKSKNPGKMHACGHDIHMTVGIEPVRPEITMVGEDIRKNSVGSWSGWELEKQSLCIIPNLLQILRRLGLEQDIFLK